MYAHLLIYPTSLVCLKVKAFVLGFFFFLSCPTYGAGNPWYMTNPMLTDLPLG